MASKDTLVKTADTNKAPAEDSKTKTPMPLFYTNPVPLDSNEHADMSLKTDFNFDFTKEINAVPVNLIEIPQVSRFYPIAFGTDDSATPVAILGVRNEENLFVEDDGNWRKETYIPAYIRRYPFIFSETPDSEQLALCIDMNDDVVEKTDKHPFFDKNGKPTTLSKNGLEFCKSYHAASEQTNSIGKALLEKGLLIDRQADMTLENGQKISFSGFRVIDEKKFAKLDKNTLHEWHNNGWLSVIYAHLFSMNNWAFLTQLLNQRL